MFCSRSRYAPLFGKTAVKRAIFGSARSGTWEGVVPHMPSEQIVNEYIDLARNRVPAQDSDDDEAPPISPNTNISGFSSLGIGGGALSSATSYIADAHAVPPDKAKHYYHGLPSKPALIYGSGEDWSPPRGPGRQRRPKELRAIFNHKLVELWNEGFCLEIGKALDNHQIRFTSLEFIRFKEVQDDDDDDDAEEPVLSPPTVWVGVPGTTPPTAAHNAAQAILALLRSREITDVNVEFRESEYISAAGPRLLSPVGDLDPLVDVVSPLTPALGLRISTTARPRAQGTMALYLAEGGESTRLLGLTCRHVLIGPNESKDDYTYHRSGPAKNVILLGQKAYSSLIDSIIRKVAGLGILTTRWKSQIMGFEERESGADPDDVERARTDRIKTQGLLDDALAAMDQLIAFRKQVEGQWSKENDRILGHVLSSPAISLGVGPQHYTEDWGVFEIDRAKLGDGFQGNLIDLGTKISPDDFTLMCFPHHQANWTFEYPDNRLLPIRGVITKQLMRSPDMLDEDGEPCLLVVKNGNAAGTTLGRANGVFSIVRTYTAGGEVVTGTSMEWGIINYNSKADVFCKPGDSGSLVADIRGRAGGMITAGAGQTDSLDMTYATPMSWLLTRIKANGFPNAHLNVV
ncbi:hypothetical protein AX16_009453 [Volvariella volvacea WC 439]|nr:hypothetical protein AX16_009453 [Volvariella volvacea WC 439]